mgnify:CR=1 FL=1
MDMLLHKAATRGYFDHGWLRTHHTFSFADYYDPARLNFGALRVLNDDTVVPGAGFGMHPHREMEVVSIPLSGRLEHKAAARPSSFCKYGFSRTVGASSPATRMP